MISMSNKIKDIPLVSKWIRFPWHKHPSWTSTFIVSDQHGLVQARYPGTTKNFAHMLVPFVNQLEDLSKPVLKGLFLLVGVVEVAQNVIKAVTGYPTV